MITFIIGTMVNVLYWASMFGWGYQSGRPGWKWAFRFPVTCWLVGLLLWVVSLVLRGAWLPQGIEKVSIIEWLLIAGAAALFFSSSYFSGRWLGKRHARRDSRLWCPICDGSVTQTETSWRHCDMEVQCPVLHAYFSPTIGQLRWPGLEWRDGAWRGESDFSIGCYGGVPDHWLPEEV